MTKTKATRLGVCPFPRQGHGSASRALTSYCPMYPIARVTDALVKDSLSAGMNQCVANYKSRGEGLIFG